MNKLIRNTEIRNAVSFLNESWLLNLYIIRSDRNEHIIDKTVESLIERHLLLLESTCMSDEFDYLRTGFVFLHYGDRGIDLSIWHIGKWGKTFEIFNCSWYCYDRNNENMELLDSAEPVFSMYEISLLTHELNICRKIFKKIESDNQFRILYIEEARVLDDAK